MHTTAPFVRRLTFAAALSLALAPSAGAAELKVFSTQALTGTFARRARAGPHDTNRTVCHRESQCRSSGGPNLESAPL